MCTETVHLTSYCLSLQFKDKRPRAIPKEFLFPQDQFIFFTIKIKSLKVNSSS